MELQLCYDEYREDPEVGPVSKFRSFRPLQLYLQGAPCMVQSWSGEQHHDAGAPAFVLRIPVP